MDPKFFELGVEYARTGDQRATSAFWHAMPPRLRLLTKAQLGIWLCIWVRRGWRYAEALHPLTRHQLSLLKRWAPGLAAAGMPILANDIFLKDL